MFATAIGKRMARAVTIEAIDGFLGSRTLRPETHGQRMP
jgi:hypothetical protein